MPVRRTRKPKTPAPTTGERLRAAALGLFAERGFAQTSMRDIARAGGISLSGIYHYVPGKDALLFELQRDAFGRLLRPPSERKSGGSPARKIRQLIGNHIELFSAHITEMKVLSHESGALRGPLAQRMRRMRRDYYRQCREIVTELLRIRRRRDLDPRVTTMALFGMINWIYTWYRPDRDGPADKLARQMAEIFLRGVDRAQTRNGTAPRVGQRRQRR